MSKTNIQRVENTGGQLKYIQNFEPVISDIGLDIDFTVLSFEDDLRKCSHIEIFNDGPGICMIGFDTDATLLDCLDRATFNFPIFPGKPYNYFSEDGQAESISMRTLPGKTATLFLVVW